MDAFSSSSLNFYGAGTNEFLGIVLSGDSQKDQLSGLAGWGWRYRVAIMGHHPVDQGTIKDEEITYAICALGTCDGSGGAGRLRTPKISPGDVVLGRFLDGDKRQIPMITNVLGRTSGVKYGSGRFDVKSGFGEDVKAGGLGQQEYNQQDNVVSGVLTKKQPPKGDGGKTDQQRKNETAALIEKQTGITPGQGVGTVSEARSNAVAKQITNTSDDVLKKLNSGEFVGRQTVNDAPSPEALLALKRNNLQFKPFREDSDVGQRYPGGGVITSLFEE